MAKKNKKSEQEVVEETEVEEGKKPKKKPAAGKRHRSGPRHRPRFSDLFQAHGDGEEEEEGKK